MLDDIIAGFTEPLAAMFEGLSTFLLYPFSWVSDILHGMSDLITSTITGIFSALWSFPGIVYSMTLEPLTEGLPIVWISILMLSITVNVALRVYEMLRGTSIFGWSIG